MLNFESMNKEYRARIHYRTEVLLDKLIEDHVLKGGKFDAQKITQFFGTSCRIAQLVTDLEIGTGLDPLPLEEKDEDTHSSETINKSISDAQTFTPDEARWPTVVLTDERDLGEDDTEGPPGSGGDEVGVCDPDDATDEACNHGPTGGGEVNPAEQQPVLPVAGPRKGRGHRSGPASPKVHSPSGD